MLVRLPTQEGDCCGTGNWVFNMHCMYTRHLTYRSNRIHHFPLRNTHIICDLGEILPFASYLPLLPEFERHWTDSPPAASLTGTYLLPTSLCMLLLHGPSCRPFSYYLLLITTFLCWSYLYPFLWYCVYVCPHIFLLLFHSPYPTHSFLRQLMC